VDQNQAFDLCFCCQLCHCAGIAVIDGRRDMGPVIRQVNFTLLFSPKICTTPLPDQARAIASKLFGHFEHKIGKSLLFLLDRRG
jgi:hypothetical protein